MAARRRWTRDWAAALLLLLIVVTAQWTHAVVRARSASEVHATSYALNLLPPVAVPLAVPIAPLISLSSVQMQTTPPSETLSLPVPASLTKETQPPPLPDVFLVIGVKTRVLRGLEARRAIRETWAAPASTAALGVRVVFLGCEPDLSMLQDVDKTSAQQAIAAEKAAHHDFWTHELLCQDSFFTLVDKIVAFFDVAQTQFPTLAYAMVVDDDVYVRMDRLVALLRSDRIPTERFYGGNVAEKKQLQPTQPIRNPESRYYLPFDMYPIADLPPFFAGAHFVLSRDIVRFIARNRRDLRGLKGLDDATIALWMLALQIRPVFLLEFQIVRSYNCTEALVSYADLGPHAIRTAHANLVAHRGFCAGFNYTQWFKQYDTIDFGDDDDGTQDKRDGDVQFNWDIEIEPASSRLRILTTITVANQSVALLYTPASATYASAFCNHILPLLEAKLSILVGTNFCRFHRKFLLRFLKTHDANMPSVRPLLTLTRHNLERDAIDDENNSTESILLVRVVTSTESVSVYVLAECLLVAAFPDKHIVVVRDRDQHALHQNQRPDIVVVVSSADTVDVNQFSRRFKDPNSTLLVLSTDGRRIAVPEGDPRIGTVDASDHSTSHARHFYVPPVSMALAGSIRYSLMALLRPVVAEVSSTQPQSFCAVLLQRCGTIYKNGMLNQLRTAANGQVDTIDECINTPSIDSTSPTLVDDTIDLYRGYKFIVAFDDDADMAGMPESISAAIAMAFLAGSIPVYYGHSEMVTRLFNPKAFIHCRRFASLHDCGDFVTEIQRSPSLYERMQSEPPVVNTTAFVETFSWHPQVAALATENDQALVVGHRLRQLLRGAGSF